MGLKDPPIGPNGWGDFFQHFYDPDTGKGFKGIWDSAPYRAGNYFLEILNRIGCFPKGTSIPPPDKEKIYDLFGRILHLLQDMGNPSHTRDDAHVFTKTFEDYVNNHWSEIVKSEAFKEGVTPAEYIGGKYGEFPDIHYPVFYPDKFMESLARISKNYFTDGQGTISDEQLQQNANRLIPETIKYTAGYINAIYQWMSGGAPGAGNLDVCNVPPKPTSPGNDHPDDRFDVSDEFYWEREFGLSDSDLTELYLRTAIKKGKIGLWHKKRLMEIFIEGRTQYSDAPQETKNAIESEFQAAGRKLDGRRDQFENEWKGAPDIALFSNGFYKPSISLMLKIGEPVSFKKIDFDPKMIKDHPILLVPTGGFYGLKNSTLLKALLREYVNNGGTLVVFSQQHGYDWGLLPAPVDSKTGEERPISGYGYQEDQSCQFNSVYVDSYHPVLSVFSTSTANIGVDGYFTSYPDQSTVLLRRVSNGQPAMIIYPYGNGQVIATTLYTDFAFSHSQANQAELNFLANIISWAKKPEDLVEIGPAEEANLTMTLSNFTDSDAVSAKFTVLGPNRKVISESTHEVSLPMGQSTQTAISYPTASDHPLGIYHIDYSLYDSIGKMIQPRAETDSGRFVVSNPPQTPAEKAELTFSIQSDAEDYIYGSVATFTIIAFNESETERNVTVSYDGKSRSLSVPPKGTTGFTYEKEITTVYYHWGHSWGGLWAIFAEGNNYLTTSSKTYWVTWPSANVTVQTDKGIYRRGETVSIDTSIKINNPVGWPSTIKITVLDPFMTNIFEDSKTITLSPSGTGSVATQLTLPGVLATGNYGVIAEIWYGNSRVLSAYGNFEVSQSQISVTGEPPPSFAVGEN
ncbi:MAG: hypothetical protein V1930_05555, partial [Pseudomonadota bacterium]